MPKNIKKTSFYFFAKEYALKNGCGIQQAIEQSYMEWKSLTPLERSPYEKMLISWKESQNDDKKEVLSVKVETVNMDLTISNNREERIRSLSSKFKKIDVKKLKFYFIKFLNFCKTDDLDPIYVPAEVGLVEYSLEEGITNTYHKFIKPGPIPPGYASMCKMNSKEYHQIPLHHAEASGDYANIFTDIEQFIKQSNQFNKEVYCLESDIEETKYSLNWLSASRGDKLCTIETLELQCMLIALAAVKFSEMSFVSATELLTSYHYDYTTNSRCQFHENIGTHFCALGFVKRYCYMISDHLCIPFNITPIRDKHLPVEQVTSVSVSVEHSDFRSISKRIKGSLVGSRVVLNETRSDYDPSDGLTDIRYRNRTAAASTISTITSLKNESTARSVSYSEAASSHPRKKVADMFVNKIPAAAQAPSMIASTTTGYAASSDKVDAIQSRFKFENFEDSVSVADRSEHGFLNENREEDVETVASTIDADDDDDTLSYQRSIIGGVRFQQRSKFNGRTAYRRTRADDDNRSAISSQSSGLVPRGRGINRR